MDDASDDLRVVEVAERNLDALLDWIAGTRSDETPRIATELRSISAERARALLEAWLFVPGNDDAARLFDPEATEVELRQRYRRLMRLFHPDRRVGDETRLNEYAARINEAHRIARASPPRPPRRDELPSMPPGTRSEDLSRAAFAMHLRRRMRSIHDSPLRSLRGWPGRRATPRAARGRLQALGLAALIVLAALAKGGVAPGARAALAFAVAGLFCAALLPQLWRSRGPAARELTWLVPWCVVTVLVGLQLAPLPEILQPWLGSHPAELRGDPGGFLRLSPMPLETVATFAAFTTCWVTAFFASRLSRAGVRWLAAALVLLASFEAVYGLAALAHDSRTILGFYPREHYLHDATGSFVNRNHYAALLALCLPLGPAFLLSRERAAAALSSEVARRAAALVYTALLACALVASHSRMGAVAALIGMAIWIAADRSRTGAPWRLRQWALPAGALAAALGFGVGPLLDRFGELSLEQNRFLAWQAIFSLPAQTWVLGAGAGAFPDVFQTVQPPGLARFWSAAHNDWLELVLGFGVVGTFAIAASMAWWARRILPLPASPLRLGALCGVLAIAVHALGDFSLQIPGVALPASAVLGIALHPRLGSGPRHSRSTC